VASKVQAVKKAALVLRLNEQHATKKEKLEGSIPEPIEKPAEGNFLTCDVVIDL
jgi:hypothetical protein